MMDKHDLRKCLYCDYRSSEMEERKRHLKEEHYEELVELARKSNQTIEWAAGHAASYFAKDNTEPQATEKPRDG